MYALLTMTILSGIALSSSLAIAEDNEVIDTVELTVPVACTMGGTGQTSHNASINPGTYSGASGSEYEAGIGKTTLTTFCNDNNGFSVYAIGFTNDLYEGETHTKLIGQNTNLTISTKVYSSGDTDSNWSMKVTKVDNPVSGDPVTYNPDNMSIQNSFNSWHAVPDVYTKVAQYNSSTTDPATTDTTLGAKIETTYATYISSAQAADTYQGQVKYTMVHPYNHTEPEPPSFKILYTGRALSTEPGQENPVTVKMTELPQDGKYNLLGTEDGLYDKLTTGELYGGYYKYSGDIDVFTSRYLDNYEVYDGKNFDWESLESQTIDAAEIEPDDGDIYIVKEVPTKYLRSSVYYTSNTNTGALVRMYYISGIDLYAETYSTDFYYNPTGFTINGVDVNSAGIYTHITTRNAEYNVVSFFGSRGVEAGYIAILDANAYLTVGEFTVLPYWVTPDSYKVSGASMRTITITELTLSGYSSTTRSVQPTITKWEGP